MTLLPTGVFGVWLLGLLSLGLLGGGGYLVYAWYAGAVVGAGYLAAGLLLLLASLLGRPLLLLLFRPDPDPPRPEREGDPRPILRPDGTRLHAEVSGPEGAPVLVFTHGWGNDATQWYHTRRALGQDFRLIAWDLPGLGLSAPRRDGDYRPQRLADDLEAVLSLAGGAPAYLVGHSIGGMTTLSLCKQLGGRLGGRVAGLALVHTTPTNPVRTTTLAPLMRALQGPLLVPLCYLMIGLAPLFWLTNWLSYLNGTLHLQTLLTGFVRPTRQALDRAARYSARAWPGVTARGMLGMLRYDAADALPDIGVPALVVAGSRDPLLPPDRSSRVLAEALPHARYAELAPAKHMGFMEQHARFNALLAEFAHQNGDGDSRPADLRTLN